MPSRKLLLVEPDGKWRRAIRTFLRNAGFEVLSATDKEGAVAALERTTLGLVIAAVDPPELDTVGLTQCVRELPSSRRPSVILLALDSSFEHKIRIIGLGADDCLQKPLILSELAARVRARLAERLVRQLADPTIHRELWRGLLSELGVYDLVGALERGQRTGVLWLRDTRQRGGLVVREGQLVDATLGGVQGTEAVYRALVCTSGSFKFEPGPVKQPPAITMPTSAVLDEGVGYAAAWQQLVGALPPLDTVLVVDRAQLKAHRKVLPNQLVELFELFDGARTLYDVLDDSPWDDLSTLSTIGELRQMKVIAPPEALSSASTLR